MANIIVKLYKVRVIPKDLKSIPGILPYDQFIEGEPKDVELTKMEIMRCMNFGDVFMMDGEDCEEEPINTVTYKDLVFFEKIEEGSGSTDDTSESGEPTGQSEPENSNPRNSSPMNSYSQQNYRNANYAAPKTESSVNNNQSEPTDNTGESGEPTKKDEE